MLSFTLSDEFIEPYQDRKVEWGYEDAAGNSLGEITFLAKYSRKREDGTKERWHEVCRRVIEGMFSIQKDHCKTNRLPWNDHKAQRSARDAYERMFTFKWLPPGRGLWAMGTPLVNKNLNSAPLQNCAFVSTADMTKYDPTGPFTFLMEASMLGIGVGFDDKGADKGYKIFQPCPSDDVYSIPDTREGWVESVKLLLESFWMPNKKSIEFDYSLIRAYGEPIKTFGGTAAGPGPLRALHVKLREIFTGRQGTLITRTDIADVGNLIGKCVVAGNVRRSAELLIGHLDDPDFIDLKNYQVNPERNFWSPDPEDKDKLGWGHLSNNSVSVSVGDDYSSITDGIARNGEPGLIWMDISRQYGRLIDPPTNADFRVAGYNPCAEQSLESFEMCTLVETFMNRHESLDDFKQTLKYAFLYAKTVTLLPTHWQRTNAIMQRNRRIGCSVSGVSNFVDTRTMSELRIWLDEGYKIVQGYDKSYSEWMCIRQSIKTTTVKPSGTVSILAGESPGVHWTPGGTYFMRTQRFRKEDPLVSIFRTAQYRVEPDVTDPETAIVYFPINNSAARRSEKDVTLFEKANLAVTLQRYWSDNSVSVTLSFKPEEEGEHIGTVLSMYEGQMKTASFLPMSVGTYQQMPFGDSNPEEWEEASLTHFKVDLSGIYNGLGSEAEGDLYCTTDACLVKEESKPWVPSVNELSGMDKSLRESLT